ncbi:MAG: AMP-binding protein [Burkholderiaceae bacterium]|nr:AMP-binding protein [Burkholderiaceae bacterium]
MKNIRDKLAGVVYPSAEALSFDAARGIEIEETLTGALKSSFVRNGTRTALVGVDGSLTYSELDEQTDQLAAGLVKLGLQPLDRAIFQMANGAALIKCLVACWKCGVIPICTLPSHRQAEIGYLANHAKAKAYFVQAGDPKFDQVQFALGMQAEIPSIERVIVAGKSAAEGVIFMEKLIHAEGGPKAREVVDAICTRLDPRQPVVFQLSGGTTGVPKIIPRFQSEYLYNIRSVSSWGGRNSDEVLFCAGPMIHNAGVVCHWGPTLLNGGAVVTDNDLSVSGLANILQTYQPTWMFLPRPLLSRVKEALKTINFDKSRVKGVVTASNSKTVREELGLPGIHIFGMAEGLVMTTRAGDSIAALDETVGMPVSPYDEVLIVTPGTSEPVPFGDVGEMICKGPYTVRGYYDAPDRDKAAFTDEGFYRSGDLMSQRRIDGKDYYVFEGRLKDVINRAGEKVSCDEVERALRGYPNMIDVALVAMPDEDYIEKGCAFVVMERDHHAPSVKEFGEYLKYKGLAKYKWPERVEQIESLPTTSSAKISKPLLREMIAAKLRSEKLAHQDAAAN